MHEDNMEVDYIDYTYDLDYTPVVLYETGVEFWDPDADAMEDEIVDGINDAVADTYVLPFNQDIPYLEDKFWEDLDKQVLNITKGVELSHQYKLTARIIVTYEVHLIGHEVVNMVYDSCYVRDVDLVWIEDGTLSR